ncbi:MAG: hypothetical protein WCG64_00935 [Flavobacteriia bacterium]
MKNIYFTLLLFLTSFTFGHSQPLKNGFNKPVTPISPEQTTNPTAPTTDIEVIFHEKGTRSAAADKYIVDIKKLSNYFKRNQIPTHFPKYDKDLSFDANKLVAMQWLNKHKRFLKKEEKEKFKNKYKL